MVDFGELSCLGYLVCVPQNLRGASSSFVGAELGIAIICPATGASAEGARYCTYVVQEGILVSTHSYLLPPHYQANGWSMSYIRTLRRSCLHYIFQPNGYAAHAP